MGYSQAFPSLSGLVAVVGRPTRSQSSWYSLCAQGVSETPANAAAGVLVGLPPAQLHKEALVLVCERVIVLEIDLK